MKRKSCKTMYPFTIALFTAHDAAFADKALRSTPTYPGVRRANSCSTTLLSNRRPLQKSGIEKKSRNRAQQKHRIEACASFREIL